MPPTDFDFLQGPWHIASVRYPEGAAVAFDGTSSGVTKYLDGFVNVDVNHFAPPDPHPAFSGMSLRLLDPATDEWSIYWIGTGISLSSPMRGSFRDGRGEFYGAETDEPRWRFLWTGMDTATPHWEQGYTSDGGETWTLDWTMDFSRPG